MPGILIVDDNSSIRLLLRSFVESKTKFVVCGEAGNGLQAVEKARHLQPDLVLLDLSMPVMNGAKAAVALKRMMPQTKIILFTMCGGDNIGNLLATAEGVDLVLRKPEGFLKLDGHLNELLAPTVDTQVTAKVLLSDDAIPN